MTKINIHENSIKSLLFFLILFVLASCTGPTGSDSNSTDAAIDSADVSQLGSQVSIKAKVSKMTDGSGKWQAILTWNPIQNTTTDIKQGTQSRVYTRTYPNVNSPFTVSGLIPETTYYFVVIVNSTVNGTQVSSSSAEYSVKIPLDNSTRPPGAFTASAEVLASSSQNRVKISWTASDQASYYIVQRGINSGSYPVQVGKTTDASSLVFVDSNPPLGKDLYYMVIAVNASGSTDADEVNVPSITPSSSMQLIANPGDSTVSLNWGPVANVSSYVVQRSLSPTGNFTTISPDLSANTTSYIDSTVSNQTSYYYQIIAKVALNLGGEWCDSGDGSSTQSVTCSSASSNLLISTTSNIVNVTPIAIPGGFSVTANVGDGQVSLSWTNATDAASYTVQYGTSSGSYPNTISNITTSPIVISGLSNATIYYFKITAINPSGSTNASEVSATPLLPAPGDFSLVTSIQGFDIKLDWTASDNVDHYIIRRGLAPDLTDLVVIEPSISSSTLTYTDNGSNTQNSINGGLVNGTTYYYQITAVALLTSQSANNGQTNSTPSHSKLPLAAPGDFTLSATAQSHQIELDWTAASNVDHYIVKRGLVSDLSDLIVIEPSLSSGTLTYIDTGTNTQNSIGGGIVDGVTYYYQVIAVSASPSESFNNGLTNSNSVSASTQSCPSGDYYVNSDDDVSSFENLGCTIIYGSLIVSSSSTTNLTFTHLVQIQGGAYITDNNNLSSINFPNLQSAGSYIDVESNSMTSFTMPNLQTVGSYVWISSNTSLAELNFPNLQTISGIFHSDGHSVLTNISLPVLTSVSAFSSSSDNISTINIASLQSVNGQFYIGNNNKLGSLSAPVLATINGELVMENNGSGASVSSNYSFAALQNVYNDMRINYNKFTGFSAPNLGVISNYVQFLGNTGMASIDLSNIISIPNTVNIQNNSHLNSVKIASDSTPSSDPDHPLAISGFLLLANNGASASGTSDVLLGGLQKINDNISIQANSAFARFLAPNLRSISGYVAMANNSSLATVDLSAFQTSHDNFAFNANPQLVSLDARSLTAVPGYIGYDNNGTSVASNIGASVNLSSLQSVGSNFDIQGNTSLVNLDARSLLTISGYLSFDNNSTQVPSGSSTTVNFGSLQSVGSNFDIQGNTYLASFDAHSLTTIAGYLAYNNNSASLSSTGATLSLDSLQSVGSSVSIQNNPLASFSIGSLQSTGGFIVLANNTLLTTLSFSALTTVHDNVLIAANPALTSLTAPLLTTVSGFFNVNSHSNLPSCMVSNIIANPGFSAPGGIVNGNNTGSGTCQ